MSLDWQPTKFGNMEAALKNPDGSIGVLFSLEKYPTCYRRGPFKLIVDVQSGPYHVAWGCFDYQDQPMRWYHSHDAALSEAQAIADVMEKDFRPSREGAIK